MQRSLTTDGYRSTNFLFVSSRRRHTRYIGDWSSDVCSSDLAALMTDVLGYERFGAQGGDWGAFVTSRLGYQFAERLTGIHLNMLAMRISPKMLENPTHEEKVFLAQLDK